MDIKRELTNPQTRARWKHTGNWNRRIQIPGIWSGPVWDIPPHAVEALLKQGRTDFEPTDGANQTTADVAKGAESASKANQTVPPKDGDKK